MICSFHMSSSGIFGELVQHSEQNVGFCWNAGTYLPIFVSNMKRRNSKLPPLETMHPYFIKHIISMLKIRNQQFSTCCVLPTALVTTALPTFTFTAPQVVRMIAIELLNQICILRGSQRSSGMARYIRWVWLTRWSASNIFYIHPDSGGDDPIWLISFQIQVLNLGASGWAVERMSTQNRGWKHTWLLGGSSQSVTPIYKPEISAIWKGVPQPQVLGGLTMDHSY